MDPVPGCLDLPPWFAELPAVARTVWLTRTDLHATHREYRTAFLAWCLLEGRSEYRCFDPGGPDFDPALTERVWVGCPDGVDPPVTDLMHGVWARRPDLRAEFDLAMPAGAEAFVGWYFVEGIRELDLTPLLTAAQVETMTRPAAPRVADAGPGLTRIMVLTLGRRPDLQHAFDIRTSEGGQSLAAWFLTEGLREIGDARLADEPGRRWFHSPSVEAMRQFGLSIGNGLYRIWQGDPDLRAGYPADATGMTGLRGWAADEGARLYPLLAEAIRSAPAVEPGRPRPLLFSGGLNLIGHARADMGIGEDVRAAAQALKATGVPYAIVDVMPGAGISAGERVEEAALASAPVYDTTLFCTTGMEMARIVAAKGRSFLAGQRVIGCWPWELPAWPEPWRHAFDLVDEIWAASRHTQGAYQAATGKPVRWMPMAVTVPAPAPLWRPQFGLPDGDFLFLFAFDAQSYLARKNPVAAIEAFRRAFPAGDEPAGLVLKVMRAEANPEAWAVVRSAAAADPRIRLVERTCSRYELVALYQASDALVSLHRAEGFGRVLAEAMLLGKPVIATDWSGNTDFVTAETGCPVPFRLVPVGQGEYPYGDGMVWAEPEVEVAADWMRRLARDRALVARTGAAGQAAIRRENAPEVVGRRILMCLMTQRGSGFASAADAT